MTEKNFSEEVRYLLNRKLRDVSDRRKAELFGVSPASIGNYKDPEGERTPRGPKAKLFKEAIAFTNEWGDQRWGGDPMWEFLCESDCLELWDRLREHIESIRAQEHGHEVDDLHERVFEGLTNDALGRMESFVLQMHEDEHAVNLEILQRQVEREEEALWLKYKDYQLVDHAMQSGEIEDDYKRREQISARAQDFYALIEEQLRGEFEAVAAGTIRAMVSALKQVLWDGRKDSRAQFEDRVELLIRALEEGHSVG
ncbi:MAG: hypothetical protein HY912_11950 [Desulfomonile tiedjei]|uniref:Uncharacterized protein n=1 Tax=Desulfomonile tiedjei TaxID=2358 RepID=A0A9D6Z0Q6_9BACT|nr:hypothetical protein [Desulfomonile tiedjei]